MLPESANDPSSGGLTIPMAWIYAEYVADDILRAIDLTPPATLELRAGRAVLALTVFLSDVDGELCGTGVAARVDQWLAMTSCDDAWHTWVEEQLDRLEAEDGGVHGTNPDLPPARAEWQRLHSDLLLRDLLPDSPPDDSSERSSAAGRTVTRWVTAWRLGVPLAHVMLHHF